MMWLLSNCDGKWMTTRCMMMHGWPHEYSEHSNEQGLRIDRSGSWCKQSRWSNESAVDAIEWGAWMW